MSVKKNSRPERISPELSDIIKELMEKNDMNRRQASKEVARQMRELRNHKKLLRREIRF